MYLGRDAVTGRKRYLTRTFRGPKRRAEDGLNRLLLESGESSHAVVDGTFGDLAELWLEQASAALSPSTRSEYRRILDRTILPRFCSTKVRSMPRGGLGCLLRGALRWDDVDQRNGILRISRAVVGVRQDSLTEKATKTHASRNVSLDAATLTLLAEHRRALAERAAVFGTSLEGLSFVFSDAPDAGIPWRPNRVTLAFVRLCRQLGINGVRLHDLRHFAATQMLAAGIPVKTVSGRLGHAKAATTLNVYAHVLESSDASAAQVLASLLTSADHVDIASNRTEFGAPTTRVEHGELLSPAEET